MSINSQNPKNGQLLKLPETPKFRQLKISVTEPVYDTMEMLAEMKDIELSVFANNLLCRGLDEIENKEMMWNWIEYQEQTAKFDAEMTELGVQNEQKTKLLKQRKNRLLSSLKLVVVK